ncbi:hypothetical protein [Pontibacter harenae]|uniref:hypothetical protein n=1 Tax=Pontibacter harenae TaxID=2894083 RepID=UPI001E4B93C1|nr:hypothetical protein [Pontibacter harenae]MCC9165263.1 hypothetical protein [Pontibacter harenae]
MMKKSFYTLILFSTTALLTFSCSKSVEVTSVDVPVGTEFSICLDAPEDTAQTAKFFYSISFKTKTNFRYTTEGALSPTTVTAENCYRQNKMQYNEIAYSPETMEAIRNISNQNIDTLVVTIYNDPLLEPKSYVAEKIFTSEDLQ